MIGDLKNKLGIDSLQEHLIGLVNNKKKELDSLQNSISKLQKQVDSMQNKVAGDIALVKQKIYKATHQGDLLKISGEYGVGTKTGRWENFISDLKSVGIGRSMINYSELTARNVSLTGVNMEYNPRLYFAVAAGKIDYGFRDFFGKNNRSLNQHLLMGRVGFGDIENGWFWWCPHEAQRKRNTRCGGDGWNFLA